MTELRFAQVDAFAERPFTGNPAAVVPLDAWPEDELLQAIAEENNLAETAFTVPVQGEADYELRWFTPTVEVALCGHATLAAGHVLMKGDRIRFLTRKSGILEVTREAGGYALSLPALKGEPKPLPAIAAALGCEAKETLLHPNGYAVVVLDNEADVLALKPDFPALVREGGVLAIVTAPGTSTDVVSRVFAPAAGIDEDPVTGSAHAVLTPYWAERLGRDRFTAFQASSRGGHLSCRLEGDRAVLGGTCVTVIEGRMRI
jgi:PhzF family phenazine biosynthesis protein